MAVWDMTGVRDGDFISHLVNVYGNPKCVFSIGGDSTGMMEAMIEFKSEVVCARFPIAYFNLNVVNRINEINRR